MGTNYYAIPQATEERKEEIKKAVDRDDFEKARDMMGERIHIGKSSMGWEFKFDHNYWEYFNKDKDEIVDFIDRCNIYDEYGRYISHGEFWQMVENKKGGLNSLRYKEEWENLHGDLSRPSYMFEKDYGDIYVDDLCFSQHSPFS
jgi:hypothetical protein